MLDNTLIEILFEINIKKLIINCTKIWVKMYSQVHKSSYFLEYIIMHRMHVHNILCSINFIIHYKPFKLLKI